MRVPAGQAEATGLFVRWLRIEVPSDSTEVTTIIRLRNAGLSLLPFVPENRPRCQMESYYLDQTTPFQEDPVVSSATD